MSTEKKQAITSSLKRQEQLIRGSIILNPVENFPFEEDVLSAQFPFHGLYNSDKLRSEEQQKATKHQFAGRKRLAYDSQRIYSDWARVLSAEDASLRLLSGLQAHAAIFMGISKPGDKVMLLSELAGGHMATKAILERLGLIVEDTVTDFENFKVDQEATLRKAREFQPDFLFIDRSEGLNYEDFTELCSGLSCPKIFDGSQYLSQILSGVYANPFDMGFDYFISTLHKNFPGPQKAVVACRTKTDLWAKLLAGLSLTVSNMHIASTYSAGLAITRLSWINSYSQKMLENTVQLEKHLMGSGMPVVPRLGNTAPTHHIWIRAKTKDQAFDWYKNLERNRIFVNYRLLPYELGYGLRLGLSALTRIGLKPDECPYLAELLVDGAKKERNVRSKISILAQSLFERREGQAS